MPPRRLPRSGCRPSLFLQNEANSSPSGATSLSSIRKATDSLFPLWSWAFSLIVNRCFGWRRLRGSLEQAH